jgi:hypothetical protein
MVSTTCDSGSERRDQLNEIPSAQHLLAHLCDALINERRGWRPDDRLGQFLRLHEQGRGRLIGGRQQQGCGQSSRAAKHDRRDNKPPALPEDRRQIVEEAAGTLFLDQIGVIGHCTRPSLARMKS